MSQQPASPPHLAAHDYDPNSLPVARAQQLIRTLLTPISEQETVALERSLQRTLALDIASPIDVPPQDNSAMDGYALRLADLIAAPATLRIAGRVYAGHPFDGVLSKGACVRIMTGAPIPEGCDCVVMQEHVKVENDAIVLSQMPRAGQNIRRAGEDMRQGEIALSRGQLIRPAEMGLLAALGIKEIPVYRKLRVAIFSTGDELAQPGHPLAPGQIYDSNRYSLIGMLNELGAEVVDMGSVRDDRASLKRALLLASEKADAIITSGGVSVGEADYIKELLSEIGEVVFWKLAMKPGRPLAYGKIGRCHFFGLPGNPVAVIVTFRQFVANALRVLMGQSAAQTFTFPATLTTPIRKLPGRTEFQRGILSQDANGQLTVASAGEQGSNILSAMSRANCFIVLPEAQGNAEPGTTVQVQMLQA
jgi:molybdopterin molybdotransferase